MLQASGPSLYPVGLGPIMGAGLGGYMQAAPYDEYLRRQQQMQQSLGQIGQTVRAGGWQSTAAPLAQASGIPMAYLNKLAGSESGGQNVPTSIKSTSGAPNTAFGPFQFNRGTWQNVAQMVPQLGLRPEDRFNERAQGGAAVALTAANRQALAQSLGRQPTWGEVHLAHVFGANGANRLLNTPPQEMMRNVMPTEVDANPQWQNSTVGSIINQHRRGFDDLDTGGGIQLASARGGAPEVTAPGASPGGLDVASALALLQGQSQQQSKDEPPGTSLQNMTPDMREILSIALQDPVLGPHALQGLISAGLSQPKAAAGGGGAKLPEDLQKYLWGQIIPGYGATFEKPDKDTRTALEKDTQSIFGTTESPEAKQFMKDQMMRSDPQQIAAAVAAAVQKQQATGTNEMAMKGIQAVMDAGNDAQSKLDNIRQMQQLNAQIHTGMAAPFKKKALQVMDALGIDPNTFGITEKASDYEAFDSMAKLGNMQARNPKDGGGMPGSMSNYEDQLLQSMGSQLMKTTEGNALLLLYQQRKEERRIAHAQWANDYMAQQESSGKPLGSGWFSANNQWWQSHQVMDRDFVQQVANLTKRPQRLQDGTSVAPDPGAPGGTEIDFKNVGSEPSAPAAATPSAQTQPRAGPAPSSPATKSTPKKVIWDNEKQNLVPAQ